MEEDGNFLKATEDMWIFGLPMKIVSFLVFWAVQRKVKSSRIKGMLAKFSSFSLLTVSIMSESVLELSFFGFSQLNSLSPVGCPNWLYVLNLSLAYTTLFLAVTYSVGAPWVHVWFNKKSVNHMVYDQYHITRPLCAYLSSYFFLRFLSGYIHCQLYFDQELQILLLLAIQVANLVGVYWVAGSFKTKTHLAFVCYECCFRLVLYSLALFDVYFYSIKNTDYRLYKKVLNAET